MRATQRTNSGSALGYCGSRTRCTCTPWRTSSQGPCSPPRVRTWTSSPASVTRASLSLRTARASPPSTIGGYSHDTISTRPGTRARMLLASRPGCDAGRRRGASADGVAREVAVAGAHDADLAGGVVADGDGAGVDGGARAVAEVLGQPARAADGGHARAAACLVATVVVVAPELANRLAAPGRGGGLSGRDGGGRAGGAAAEAAADQCDARQALAAVRLADGEDAAGERGRLVRSGGVERRRQLDGAVARVDVCAVGDRGGGGQRVERAAVGGAHDDGARGGGGADAGAEGRDPRGRGEGQGRRGRRAGRGHGARDGGGRRCAGARGRRRGGRGGRGLRGGRAALVLVLLVLVLLGGVLGPVVVVGGVGVRHGGGVPGGRPAPRGGDEDGGQHGRGGGQTGD